MDEEARRLFLHNLLETIFPDLLVYFRPPGNMHLNRPCIRYEPKAAEPSWSNNSAFVIGGRYQISILSDLPGYSNADLMFDLANSGVVITSNNTYTSDDVVHQVFIVSVNTI